ncbi:MAG: metal ABC transporter permease [Phycisphaerales bacterium]|nr:metal ABC transporter permease [Phycisphaerales bacterium]
MQDFLSNLFLFRHTIIVGLALAAACSLISVFIVLRKMSLISDAIAHSGIGGIALTILAAGYLPTLFAPGSGLGPALNQIIIGTFCLATALLIGYFTKGKHVSEDSAIGIFLVASMALGILLISANNHIWRFKNPFQNTDFEKILFGDLITVSITEVYIALAALAAVAILIALFYNELVYTTLDEDMARINGVNITFINILQIFLNSLVIVVGVKMIGAMMITALTILPGATANMLSRKFNGVLLASFLTGFLGIAAGLFLAITPPLNNVSSGPVLVLTLFVIFLATWLFRRFTKPKIAQDASSPTTHSH